MDIKNAFSLEGKVALCARNDCLYDEKVNNVADAGAVACLIMNSIPNNNWPFRLVSSNTCIVDDVNSRYYNTIQSINSLPYGTHYDAIGNKLVKGYSNICIYIEHNGNGLDSNNVVPGKCSVITICGQASSISPTAGCVDISSSDMLRLISLLDYSKDPHIEIGLR